MRRSRGWVLESVALCALSVACTVAVARQPADADAVSPETQVEAATPAAPSDPASDYLVPPVLVVPTPAPEPEVKPEPEPAPEPAPPAPAVVAPALRPPVNVAPPPPSCAAGWFCYPRLGIAGPIVPYTDCSGRTDVGSAIRSVDCVSRTWIAAHAWTQFGRITAWRPGDLVFAYGAQYTVYGAYTQSSCTGVTRAVAPLSMQTSLTAANCGEVLVVQARPR